MSGELSSRIRTAVGALLRSRELYLLVIVTGLLSYTWMFSGVSVPNERTRVYLAVSIVDYDTVSIDRVVARYGWTTDIASYDGAYFSDKAPGTGFVGALVYGAARIFTRADDWTIGELVNLMRTWVMIPLGLIGFILLRRLLSALGISSGARDVASLGWILGSVAFHYSTAFYGHQLAAVAFLAALLLLIRARARHSDRTMTLLPYYMGAGAAAGVAGITEYQSAVPCLLIFAYVIAVSYRRPGRIAAFALSAAPFVVILLAYNWTAFGGPFELSYEHLIVKGIKSLHAKGIAGVSFPKAPAVFGTLLSLHRGLLTTSPMFFLLPHGVHVMWRRERGLSLLIGGSLLYYLLFNFGADVWWAGWGFGPRLLAPVLAWAVVPVAFSLDQLRSPWVGSLARGFVIVGIVYHQVVHLVFPEMPENAWNPIVDLVVPALSKGQLSPNLVSSLMGHSSLVSAIPAVVLVTVVVVLILRTAFPLEVPSDKRGVMSLVSLGVALPLVVAIVLVGPQFKEKRRRNFIKWMGKMDRQELVLNAETKAPPKSRPFGARAPAD